MSNLSDEPKKRVVSFVITNDSGMKKINKLVFDKDSTTDVISLPIGDELAEDVSYTGEVVINMEDVEKNSEMYNVTKEEELARVVTHGVLHLMGFEDNTPEAKQRMTAIEDSVVKDFKKN